MADLTIALPDDASSLLSVIALAAGCSAEAYGAICLLSGLAEQCRYHGPQYASLASALTKMTQAILAENNVATIKVRLPPEIDSIVRYEIEKQSPN